MATMRGRLTRTKKAKGATNLDLQTMRMQKLLMDHMELMRLARDLRASEVRHKEAQCVSLEELAAASKRFADELQEDGIAGTSLEGIWSNAKAHTKETATEINEARLRMATAKGDHSKQKPYTTLFDAVMS